MTFQKTAAKETRGTAKVRKALLGKLMEKTTASWNARGVLGISSDEDDRRIFGGLKFSILGFYWVRKFGKYFFG